MAGRSTRRGVPITRLGAMRVRRGATQIQLARAAGLSLSSLQRLEANTAKPLLWQLVNLALVLDCELVDVCQDEWLGWQTTGAWETDQPRNPVSGEPRARQSLLPDRTARS